MGFGSEVEDDEGYLGEQKGEDEEKKEDDSYEESELEEEKEETIWDDIDWSEDTHGEGEKTIWDDIDWSEDKHGEVEKNEEAKNEDQNDEYNKEDYVENVESQSTSTVLTNKIEEIESDVEHQEQKEQIEIRSEEYQGDTEPVVNTNEIEFIKDVEKLAEHVREIKAEDENIEPQTEKENAAYYAEQYYETLKENEVVNDRDSKEGQETEELKQETEELKQEVTEELNGHQESGCESDKLEEEDIIEASEEIISTEEFEYLWEIRDKLDQEGKTSEEIEEVMHEAEEMYETLKNAEKMIEELEMEKLKLVDHEDEASEEDLKEDLDREDLIEQAVELEEKLVQQGETQEEIDVRVEESIEATKLEERLEILIEQQELEKLKLVDHEDEASEEDLKEDLDRIDLIEQAVKLEDELVQQGETQEKIDVRVEESIETTKFEERLEILIEQQELEKLKLVDHEDEANEEDLKEDLDRIDLIEQAVKLEDELVQQGESQEKINLRVEEFIEATKLEERSEKTIEKERNELKPELEAIESEFEDKKDLLEENTKLGSEESDEEENERLQELYSQETGRRPIYAKKKTKGYSQWLEQRELGSEKVKKSKSESEKIKEIKEEDWKTTLKQWIKEASEEECDTELKSELTNVLKSYNEFEVLARKFLKLFEKSQHEKLSEKEKNILKSLTEKLQELDPIKLELSASVFFIKNYITEQYWWDFWNKPLVNRVLSKFFKHISQKYKELKKEHKVKKFWMEEQKELIYKKRKEAQPEWVKILKNWIKQSNKTEISEEYKSKLIKIINKFTQIEELNERIHVLFGKYANRTITENELYEFLEITKNIEHLGAIEQQIFLNLVTFRNFFYKNYRWYPYLIDKEKPKYPKFLAQKLKNLLKQQNSVKNIEVNKNLYKNRYMVQRYNIKFSDEEIEFFKNHDIEWIVLKSRWAWVEQHPELIAAFITEVIAPQHEGKRITKNDLRNLKFRGLEEAIKKTNKSWGQLIDEAGFTSGKPGGHYISETEKSTIYDLTKRAVDRYLNSNNKNKPSPLSELTKAEGLNVTNNTFIKYAKEYLIGRFGEKKGIDLFCKRWLGITSEELLFLRKYNYDPDGLKSRWDWLNKSLAIRFYKEIIRPKFDHTPIWEELKNTLGGFRNKLKLRTGFTYNQLITESADSPSSPCDFKKVKKKEFNDEELNFFKNYNIDWRNLKTRWDWIINDPKPPHLSIAFFKEVLYPLENGVPHQEILRRVGYRTFFEKINEIGETWESLVTKAGYQYRPPVQTECIPENKTQLIWQITQDSVDSFLKEDIIPPPIYILVYINSLDINRGTFAKYARNYLIDTYGEMRGNELFDSMWSVALHLTLGRINHILINRVLTKNFNQYNIKFISEPNIYPTQRPDGVLLIDEYTIQFFSQNHAVLNFLGISINDLKNVKLIVFDYTSDISDARVVKKIKKYQHPEVFLFIVGTRWCGDVLMKTLPDSNEIKFPGNIRIINYKVLYSLVRFSTELIQMFDLIVKLSELNKLDVLESLIESYKIELYKTDMLKDILIKQNKIIFKINEYLDFGKREYKIKTILSKEEINCITDPIYLAEHVIVIDIETTGFDSSLDKIIEIGIVELNLKTKEKIILFNSPIYEEGVDLQKNSESFTMSSLNYSDIIDAPSLESLKNTLQLIFDNFRMTSFNMNFDLSFLESRGFIFPKKLKDMMSHTREILPKGDKYNFEYAYHFFNNSSKNKGGNYLSDADYIQQHQAIDDAMYEVELLYFLYHEFKYPLDYQREITNNINKS